MHGICVSERVVLFLHLLPFKTHKDPFTDDSLSFLLIPCFCCWSWSGGRRSLSRSLSVRVPVTRQLTAKCIILFLWVLSPPEIIPKRNKNHHTCMHRRHGRRALHFCLPDDPLCVCVRLQTTRGCAIRLHEGSHTRVAVVVVVVEQRAGGKKKVRCRKLIITRQ
jgi:hypothetical protein